MIECPPVGIHEGVSFQDYRDWPAMNVSTLCEGLQSMRRLKAKLDDKLPDSDSPTMRFGRAVHSRLLEPDLFPTAFPVADQCAKIQENGNRCRYRGKAMNRDGWWCGNHAPADSWEPRDYVTEDELKRIESLWEFILLDPTAKDLHRYKGSECCFVTELCGVRVKGRIDKLIQGRAKNKAVDLKTTTAGKISKLGAEENFARDRRDLQYHTKLAFYCDAIEKLTGKPTEGCWIVIESDWPFEVASVPFEDEERRWGRAIYQDALDRVRRCQESGRWPGAYETGPMWSPQPQWYAKQFAGQEIGGIR